MIAKRTEDDRDEDTVRGGDEESDVGGQAAGVEGSGRVAEVGEGEEGRDDTGEDYEHLEEELRNGVHSGCRDGV